MGARVKYAESEDAGPRAGWLPGRDSYSSKLKWIELRFCFIKSTDVPSTQLFLLHQYPIQFPSQIFDFSTAKNIHL